MRLSPLILALGALALVACSSSSKKLQGRWRGSTVVGVAPDHAVAAQAFALDCEIVVQGDQITISTPPRKQRLATKYKVVQEDKTRTVIVTEKDGPALKETFVFSGPTAMRWDLGDGRGIEFKRQAK